MIAGIGKTLLTYALHASFADWYGRLLGTQRIIEFALRHSQPSLSTSQSAHPLTTTKPECDETPTFHSPLTLGVSCL